MISFFAIIIPLMFCYVILYQIKMSLHENDYPLGKFLFSYKNIMNMKELSQRTLDDQKQRRYRLKLIGLYLSLSALFVGIILFLTY
jgi:hypothetical protein